jgi:hypothetical protein
MGRADRLLQPLALLDQIVLEDRHLELERAIVVFVIDEQHADEFLANIDLGRIVGLPNTRLR